MITNLTLLATLAAFSTVAGAETDWRYVVPEPGAKHYAPTALPLGLAPEPPDDVRVEIDAVGEEARYGQLRYGDADSKRVAFFLDLDPDGEPRLFIDRNRDRTLEEEELVDGGTREWVTEIGVLTRREDEERLEPRRVLFRLGRTGQTLSYATLGYLEGSCAIDGEERAARRVDGNGDGFLTGERDQLWLDLDGDGQWSSLRELFLFAPVVTVAGERYVLRSDRLGDDLALEKIEGLGRIRLELFDGEGLPKGREVTAMYVLLSSKDGVVATVRGTGQATLVPPGEYRFGMVTLGLADPDGGEEWRFVFSGSGDRWYDVARDEEITIDPIGTPRIGRYLDEKFRPRAGEELTTRPWVTTEDGLLLNIVHRGQPGRGYRREAAGAKVRLLTPEGRLLASFHSGFS